jgi:hypothetical protein
VAVRGGQGRLSPNLGELTWVEGGRVVVMSTHTLTADELVALAATMQWSR